VRTSLSNLIKRKDDFHFSIESFEEENLGEWEEVPARMRPGEKLVLPLGDMNVKGSPSSRRYGGSKQDLQQVEREAYEKGFAQGQKDGLALGQTKAEELWKKMHSLFDNLTLLKGKTLSEAEEDILKLCMIIARKIVKKELATDPHTVKRSLEQAITFLKDRSFVRILVSPEDMKILEPYLPELAESRKIERFELAEDHCIEPGGCVLETGFGRINATIGNQVTRLEKELEEAFCAGGETADGD
jgi:flagellar biosynthesis/type III secretory pathway protein FliH